MKKTILLFAVIAFFSRNNYAQTVIDFDSNIYDTVIIGKQVWLKENLKVAHYNNGDPIPNKSIGSDWGNLTTGAYAIYNNNPSLGATYGYLYNFLAVTDTRGICPNGWHVPSEAEWTILVNYLGGDAVAGAKMKETGFDHWDTANSGATNSSSFTALPGGFKDYMGGICSYMGDNAFFLSTTQASYNAKYRKLVSGESTIYNYPVPSKIGASVRCLSDTTITQINKTNESILFDIYPNPVFNMIYINCLTSQYLKMQFYNTIGQCVLQKELKNKTNTIDINSLTSGIYILKLTSPNGTIEKKIIKK